MKLVRYGRPGKEKPGLIDQDGKLRDLSGKISDITPDLLGAKGLARLAKYKPSRLPLVRGRPRMGVPVAGIGKVVCIGLNFSDHAAEANMPLPKEPIIFMKATSALNGANDDVILPKGSKKSDWEVELAVVIGETASYVTKRDALKHVAGYAICNDVSEREFQIERGGNWTKGKSCDTFAPLGPWLVTADEIDNPQKLDMWLDVNGQRMQTGNTAKMVFGVQHLVWYLSQFMTLHPGDVISTGTPPGVGMGMKPQRFLGHGDVMELGIEGLGVQTQRTLAYGRKPPARKAAKAAARSTAKKTAGSAAKKTAKTAAKSPAKSKAKRTAKSPRKRAAKSTAKSTANSTGKRPAARRKSRAKQAART